MHRNTRLDRGWPEPAETEDTWAALERTARRVRSEGPKTPRGRPKAEQGTEAKPKAKRRGRTPEAKVLEAAQKYLRSVGALVVRVNSGAILLENADGSKRAFRGAKAGTSDLVACLPTGRFMAVECKAGSNKTTEAQERFLARVRAAGGLTVTCWDVDRDLRPVVDAELGRPVSNASRPSRGAA